MVFNTKISTINSCNFVTFFLSWARNNQNNIMLLDEKVISAFDRRLQAAGKIGVINISPGVEQKITYANIEVIWYNVGGKCILHQIKHEEEVVYKAPPTWDVEDICYIK